MKQNRFLYSIKLIACLAVITIHAKFPDPVGGYIAALARFAVPFFFAVSGRYLLSGVYTTGEIRAKAARSLVKIVKTTAVVYAIYQLYSLIYHLIIKADLPAVFADRFNAASIKRFILFNTSMVIYDGSYVFDHMWYLFAYIYVLIFIVIMAPILKKIYKPLTVLLLLSLHILTWMQDYSLVRVLGLSLTTWYVLRSWLFTGIPYVLLGVLWADVIDRLKKDRSKEDCEKTFSRMRTIGICSLFLGIVSTCIETYLIGDKDIYFGSFFMVMGILLMSESLSEKGKSVWKIGKEASSNIYFYHVLILAIINFGADMGVLPDIPVAIKPLTVMLLSLLFFYGLPQGYHRVVGAEKD